MFEVSGKYGVAKIFTDLVDGDGISQVISILNQPFSEGQTVRMMPDVHAGSGCAVGTTMTVKDKICPNLIGVDIGCGMEAIKLEETNISYNLLDMAIRQYIPCGFDIHDTPLRISKSVPIDDLLCSSFCDLTRARNSIGTLGSGNHFIEVDRDTDGNLWLVIHSGSRHLGMDVATYYQNEAIRNIREVVQTYRGVPNTLCWCDGYLLEHYVHDMNIVQKFADINRKAIADIIMHSMDLHPVEEFTTIHNYLDTDRMILRKGAVSAYKGQRLIIPMNMRDGSLICIGKGNPDWNYSAPHGAGRLMSRSDAKEQISLLDFEDSMKGVWTSSVSASTIDESPMAYKPMESIIENIGDTVEIIDIMKPVYNFKSA